MDKIIWLVRFAAFYNISGALIFITPGGLGLFGVELPYSPFWVWLPALMGCFASIVLLLSSMNLEAYASFPYWNSIIRLTFVIATFVLDFPSTAGEFIKYLAIGDLFLAIVLLYSLPLVLKRSHIELITNRF